MYGVTIGSPTALAASDPNMPAPGQQTNMCAPVLVCVCLSVAHHLLDLVLRQAACNEEIRQQQQQQQQQAMRIMDMGVATLACCKARALCISQLNTAPKMTRPQ
jgi:hypothetical protein